MRISILGCGVVAPGTSDVASLAAQLLGPAPEDFRVRSFPPLEPAAAKRLPRLDRMALACAREAVAPFARPPDALVWGTGYGGLGATVDFLEGIAQRGAEYGSPTAFHESVHHAAAGQMSIALGLTGPCLTVSARELSGETALQVGCDLVRGGVERVLVVAGDEVVPALVSAYRAFGSAIRPGEGAAAVLLGTEPSDLWIDAVTLTGHCVPSLRFAEADSLGPLLRDAWSVAGPDSLVSLAAFSAEAAGPERRLVAELPGKPEALVDAERFGMNPSGGLLRLVAAALRLRTARTARAALIHGLSLGGGQAAVVIRHTPANAGA